MLNLDEANVSRSIKQPIFTGRLEVWLNSFSFPSILHTYIKEKSYPFCY